ncbi:TPA: methyltransferase domain-containing protein [Enterococcus faecalis]|nr:methyltransferase domain-containing protein [Enterococcus faecalis]
MNLKETDTVYEIGTGKGHLTTKLAKISKQVTSIELDSHLFNLSSEKLKLNTRVTLIHQDILQFQFPNKQRYKIVGSIPYHLSTQIIKKVVFESHASDIYLIVEEGFYKRTLDIHRTLGLLLHTQVSIKQLLKLPYAKEEIISTHFTDYSGQDKSFEISKSSIVRNKRVLIVDDWIETGSQMKALIALLEKLDCSIIGLATIGIDINEVTQKWIDSSFVAYIGSNI